MVGGGGNGSFGGGTDVQRAHDNLDDSTRTLISSFRSCRHDTYSIYSSFPLSPSSPKDLVRTRAHVTKMVEMRSHLQGCALKLQTVSSHEAMASAMKTTTAAMVKMNNAVDAPAINKMMREFEKENMKSEMMQEIMGDMMDDVLEADGDAEEEDKIVNQVLDEIGISFAEEVPDAPMLGTGTQLPTSSGPEKVAEAAGGGPGPTPSANDPALSELEERLNNLKR